MDGADKLFYEIDEVPALAYTLKAFQNCKLIGEIIIVTREDKAEQVGLLCKKYDIYKAGLIMIGGRIRLESVMRGVFAVSDKSRLIAIHDGARPCVGQAVITGAVSAAAVRHAAAPAVKITSTVKRVCDGVISETIDRENLYEIQTPQVFTTELIKGALTNAADCYPDITDDCMAVELIGFPVQITEGSQSNIKITTQEDINIAKAILTADKAQEI